MEFSGIPTLGSSGTVFDCVSISPNCDCDSDAGCGNVGDTDEVGGCVRDADSLKSVQEGNNVLT